LAGKAGTMALMYAFPLLLLASIDNVVGDVAYVVGWAAVLWGGYLCWTWGVTYLNQIRQGLHQKLSAHPERPPTRPRATARAGTPPRDHVGGPPPRGLEEEAG